ncbi:MAG: cytochrome C [Proteobacteria bacterium]|nr:cytochrome C [Pseudomonadota bacterium]MBS0574510.1 cytochrome C [Pseudomonadota bacterium]
MKPLIASLAILLTAAPALAAGDATKGEAEFNKCKACHSIITADGTAIVKGGKTGPDLYGVVGRAAGSTDFAYSPLMKAAAAKGLVWNEEEIATYVADPTAFLREKAGETSGASKMTFKLPKGGEDVAAYLKSVVK